MSLFGIADVLKANLCQKHGVKLLDDLAFSPSDWFINHYRTRQRDSGTLAVARQLRKQGVPLEVALAILAPPN